MDGMEGIVPCRRSSTASHPTIQPAESVCQPQSPKLKRICSSVLVRDRLSFSLLGPWPQPFPLRAEERHGGGGRVARIRIKRETFTDGFTTACSTQFKMLRNRLFVVITSVAGNIPNSRSSLPLRPASKTEQISPTPQPYAIAAVGVAGIRKDPKKKRKQMQDHHGHTRHTADAIPTSHLPPRFIC